MINQRLVSAFKLTLELFETLNDDQLKLDLPDLPSNAIRDQVWCIIGARESYFKAIKNSEWKGFSCSLQKEDTIEEIKKLLQNTMSDYTEYLNNNQLQDSQTSYVFDILEHEIQHHGQLIRYIYANRLKFPLSWNKRYTV